MPTVRFIIKYLICSWWLLIYELVAGTLAGYQLGDSVTHCMLYANHSIHN